MDRRIPLGVTLVGVVPVVAVWIVLGFVPEGWGFPGFAVTWGVAFSTMGYVIDRARPLHPVGRKMLWVGPLAVVNQLAIDLSNLDGSWVAYLTPLASLFVVFLSLALHALALFPDGDWVFPGGRQVVATMWATAVGGAVFSVIGEPLGAGRELANPYQVVSLPGAADVALIVWNVTTLAVTLGVLWAFFRSKGSYRRQFGWLVLAMAVTTVSAIVAVVTDLEAAALVSALGVLGIPVGMALGITRYKLYEIDRIVSRTVSYVVVLGLLAAVYALLVLVLRSLLPGDGQAPVAASTLAVALAFLPLARRVQRFVDRRFFRSRYDSATVVARVAEDLRTTVDLDEVEARAGAVVEEVFSPETVSVWLEEDLAG